MEEIRLEQQKEIVFTYRQSEQAEPVVLRYERELPEAMRRRLGAPEAAPPDGSALWREAIAPPEKGKKGRWSVRIFVGTCLLAALVCLGAGIWYVGQYGWALPQEEVREPNDDGGGRQEEPYYWEHDASQAETTIARYPSGGETRLTLVLPTEALTAGQVYEKVNPSVVTVMGQQRAYSSVGAGIVLSWDGYILTNHHVIAGCSACQVLVTGSYGETLTYDAELVGSDEDQDLAVLKIDGRDLPAAEFGVSDDLRVGDRVYAIGNPLGLELRNTFTDGLVSAVNRDVDVEGVSMTLIQTNAALNNGNSGGPLINEYGQVVGINTIKMMSDYDTIEGLGFAIPSSLAVRWVNELIEYGELLPQPLLGVTIDRVPRRLPDGRLAVVQVISVVKGGSADLAGVRVGDYVTAFAGEEITSTEQILAIRRGLFVGDEVVIQVYRNGRYLDLTMVMTADTGG